MNNLFYFLTTDFNFALMLLGLILVGIGFWCMSDRHHYFIFHFFGGLFLITFGIPIILLAL